MSQLKARQNSWALDQKLDAGAPGTEFLAFTAAETQAIIQAVKSRLGPAYTINHLGQAATALALLKANPIPDNTSTASSIIMPIPLNGLRFLKDEYVETQYGACQAGAVVQLPDAKAFVVDDNDKAAVVSMLEKLCRMTKEQYDLLAQQAFPDGCQYLERPFPCFVLDRVS